MPDAQCAVLEGSLLATQRFVGNGAPVPLCPPRKPHPRSGDRAASAGVRRGGGGEGRALSSAHAVRVLGAPVAAQLTGELRTGRSRDPGAGGALVRVVSCARHHSASVLRRWLRRAGSALLTWDPEPETPLASRFLYVTKTMLIAVAYC
ncbi:hypothetical protein NDU88_006362 [Pleurodeles waltl]|uniref:Uncharacterized protein n=1 Tax=Pleurodeles waltl TaxID=8319 RepID=A0AAV7UKS8_PLEWA|nr:hypothetical protein NDU88_006362 [Pleurodeles waltl]